MHVNRYKLTCWLAAIVIVGRISLNLIPKTSQNFSLTYEFGEIPTVTYLNTCMFYTPNLVKAALSGSSKNNFICQEISKILLVVVIQRKLIFLYRCVSVITNMWKHHNFSVRLKQHPHIHASCLLILRVCFT